MKNFILLILFSSFITGLQAQTLKVKHKSHSGTDATFAINSTKNFGLPDDDYFDNLEKNQTLKANKPLKSKAIKPLLIKPQPLKKIKVTPKKPKKSKKLKLFKKRKKKTSSLEKSSQHQSKTLLANTPKKSASYSNSLWFILIGIAVLMYHLPYRNTEES